MGVLGDIASSLSSVSGVVSPLATIAGGVSAIGSLFGKSPEDKAMELAKLQHDWDVAENQKNRDFQSSEWTRQFNAVNAYNDPSESRKRLMMAGLNASALLNGQGSAVGNSSSSASAPSGASGLNAIPDVVSQVGYQSQESLFRRLSMLGDLSKNSNLLPETKQKLSAEIQNLLSDSKFTEVRSKSEELALKFEKLFGKQSRSVSIQHALSEIALADAESELAIKNGEKVDEEKWHIAVDRLLKLAQKRLTEADAERVEKELQWIDSEKRQSIKESKSREAANYASAAESRASADQIEFYNKINNRPDVKHEIVRAAREQGKAAVNSNAISANQAKHMEYLIEQAAYASDMKEFTYWSNQVNQFVGTIGQAASQFYGAGALRELINLRKMQQSPPSRVSGFQP